jgi:hypothetical protein
MFAPVLGNGFVDGITVWNGKNGVGVRDGGTSVAVGERVGDGVSVGTTVAVKVGETVRVGAWVGGTLIAVCVVV